MKKKIAFYITPAGGGHGIRCGVMIDTLLKLEEDLEIHVKSQKESMEWLKKYLKEDERLFYYEEDTDMGELISDDAGNIIKEYMEEYVDTWDERAEAEKAFLIEKDIGLVISDICPWIFLATDDLRIKSLLMADHTWDQMLEDSLSEELCDVYRECYELASKVFIYDIHHPAMEEISGDYEKLSMMLRPHDMDFVEEMMGKKEKAFLYLDAEIAEFFEVRDTSCHYIVNSAVTVEGADVTVVSNWPENTHNYIAICDYVITNGDWNTLSEALLTNKKIAVCPRRNHAQEKAAASLLEERGQGIVIEEKELKNIGAIIARLDEFEFSYETEYHNDDYNAAKKILMEYPKRRRRKRT